MNKFLTKKSRPGMLFFSLFLTCRSAYALRHPRRNREGDFGDGIRRRFAALRRKPLERKILHRQDFSVFTCLTATRYNSCYVENSLYN